IVQAVIGNPYLSLGALALAGLAGLVLATRLPARSAGTLAHPGTAPGAEGAAGAGPVRDAGTATEGGPA
ncbi:MAG TPA: hypothetical protein VEH31_09485, partial [Streptosporangiaceae bacterium]|nr:hypothetical protein [Streptosporangiaceae bacterium]